MGADLPEEVRVGAEEEVGDPVVEIGEAINCTSRQLSQQGKIVGRD